MSFHDFDSLDRALHSAGNVLPTEMGRLRDACGKGRLGRHVIEEIRNELERRSISFLPEPLPNNQLAVVLLYRKHSSPGQLISSAITAARSETAKMAAPERASRRTKDSPPERPSGALSAPLAGPMMEMIRSLDRAESRPGHTFVGLKWFRDVAFPADTADTIPADSERSGVLSDAIARGIVLTGKVPNPQKPDFPVTAVRLNRALPEVQMVLRSAAKARDFKPRAIRGKSLSATVLSGRR